MDTTQLIKQYLINLSSTSVGQLINIAGNYGSFNDFLDQNREYLADINFFIDRFKIGEPIYIELEKKVEELVATTNYNLYIKAYIRKMFPDGVEFDDKFTFSFAMNKLIYVAYDNIIKFYQQEQEQQSMRSRRTKANRLTGEKIIKVKAFFNLIKKTKTIVDFLGSQTKVFSNKLGHEATSAGKATLACMAFYIVRVFLESYETHPDFGGNLSARLQQGEDLRNLPRSAQLIIAILRIIIRKYLHPVRTTTKVMKYYVNGNNLFETLIPHIPSNIFVGFDENRVSTLNSSDYENSLLEAVFRIIPENIILQAPKDKKITKKNTHVINNGVVSSNILNYNPLCTVGNFMDGYKNFKCPGNFIDYERVNDNLSSGFQVNTENFKYFLRCNKNADRTSYSVNLNVQLSFYNRQIELYDPFVVDTDSDMEKRDPLHIGRSRLKTKITPNYKSILEAANVAKNAFLVLFGEDKDENNIPLLETVPQESANQDEYVRLNALLNTEFLGQDGSRSLYNRFHGTFLAKTTGDTSQYLEANTQKLLGDNKVVFKIDNDRPAWVADLIYRRFVKPGLNKETNNSHSGLIMGDKQFWCTDDISSNESLGVAAWQLIFLVDTFHDYDGNNMVSRFGTCVEELLKLYLLKSNMSGGGKPKKGTTRTNKRTATGRAKKTGTKRRKKTSVGSSTKRRKKINPAYSQSQRALMNTIRNYMKKGRSKTKRRTLGRGTSSTNSSGNVTNMPFASAPATSAVFLPGSQVPMEAAPAPATSAVFLPGSQVPMEAAPATSAIFTPKSQLPIVPAPSTSAIFTPKSQVQMEVAPSTSAIFTPKSQLPNAAGPATSAVFSQDTLLGAQVMSPMEIDISIENLYEEMTECMASYFIMNLLDLYLTDQKEINSLGIKMILFNNLNNENIVNTYGEDFNIFGEIINNYGEQFNQLINNTILERGNMKLLEKVRELHDYMDISHNNHNNFEYAFELTDAEKEKILKMNTETYN